MGFKMILNAHSSGRSLGEMQIEENSGLIHHKRTPQVHLLPGTLAEFFEAEEADRGIPVVALLDTGADVTVMRKEKRVALDNHRGIDLHIERKIRLNGNLCAVYGLVYLLPGGDVCPTDLGIVEADTDSSFGPDESFDLFLGQDILNQFIVTFDGPQGTVTIELPDTDEQAAYG